MGRRSSGLVALLALQVASEYHRLGWKPPVTTGLLLTNTLIYLRPGPLDRLLPHLDQVAFNPNYILKYGDLKRFFLSAFYHMGESHLFYNMTSLLWKGIQLETSMGSVEFASMVASLLCLSQGVMLILAKSLLFFDYETAYYRQFGVGFSGVLFAMKVVLNSESDGYSDVFSVQIPSRHAAWAELILIQLFVPGVSFLGHFGGIIAGLIYLRLRNHSSGFDPLAALVRTGVGIASWPFRYIQSWFQPRHGRIAGRGAVGRGQPSRRSIHGVWRCPLCSFDNSGLVDVCEMCSTERDGHGFTSVPLPDRSGELSLDEVRRRRLERFAR